MKTETLSPELLRQMDTCWSAANHLPVGQILPENPHQRKALHAQGIGAQ